jgi:hypothetical protein
MRLVAVGVPVGLGALASGVSWQLALLLIGAAPLAARRLLTPFVADEHERRAARRARLAEARPECAPYPGRGPGGARAFGGTPLIGPALAGSAESRTR